MSTPLSRALTSARWPNRTTAEWLDYRLDWAAALETGDAVASVTAVAAFRGRSAPAAWAAHEIDPPEGMPVLGRAPVPANVSRFQARAALAMAGLLPQVEAAIAASGNVIAQLAWADAVQFYRHSPTIIAMANALGLTEAQVDDLFRTAAGIVA